MAEQVFTVPLANVPQQFSIPLGGRQLNLTSKYNENSGWVLDIYDGVDNSPLIMNLPLVTGTDLLEQFSYVGIPGSLIVYTDGAATQAPTMDSLGRESNLYYIVDTA